MIVMKFGGTSVGDGEAISRAADIICQTIKDKGGGVVVVVSAMSGVTDTLLSAATSAAQGDAETFRRARWHLSDRHRQAITESISRDETQAQLVEEVETLLSDFESLCRSIHIMGELTARGSDAVASLGERLTARILAAVLRGRGERATAVEATETIITNGKHGAAVPLMDETREAAQARLMPLLAQGVIPVVTGFIAATKEGVTTTLGRGGSDYTAAILGASLDSDEIWIWTDVDGVMTADPVVVREARTLPEISYSEAAELSYFGAKVLHPKTILPAVERGIPLRIVNTFNPSHPGTLVVAEAKPSELAVKGITSIKGLSLVTVEGRGMLGVPGVAARVFTAVAQEGISVLMISQSSSEQNICFIIRQETVDRALRALEAAFETELARRNVDRIWAQNEVAIVAVVGAEMKGTPGIAAKVFGALGGHAINVISIAQGSSEYNISFVVNEEDMEDAVRYIHQEFGLGRRPEVPPEHDEGLAAGEGGC
ncbi:MAG: aspartate kinase [Anaerolineales bacterium]|nr:aspartate kinase [Anaerolineales bacterium]